MELGDELKAVEAGELQVGDDQVVRLQAGLGQAGIAPRRQVDRVPLRLQHLAQGGCGAGVVFNEQESW
jgi:hypothetical protein